MQRHLVVEFPLERLIICSRIGSSVIYTKKTLSAQNTVLGARLHKTTQGYPQRMDKKRFEAPHHAQGRPQGQNWTLDANTHGRLSLISGKRSKPVVRPGDSYVSQTADFRGRAHCTLRGGLWGACCCGSRSPGRQGPAAGPHDSLVQLSSSAHRRPNGTRQHVTTGGGEAQ